VNNGNYGYIIIIAIMFYQGLTPMNVRLLSVLCVLVLSACASVPPILETAKEQPLVTYEDVVMTMAPPGSMARWGGVIAQVENNAQASIIEVVHYPLKSDGRPNLRKASIGRFKVLIDGFIDPLVFKQERVVSVVGTIGEPIEGMVSEQVYIYPSINATGYYLWEDIQDFEYSQVQITPFFRFGHHFGFDLGFPFYRTRYHGVYNDRGRIRVRSNNTQSGSVGQSANGGDGAHSNTPALPQRNEPRPAAISQHAESNVKYSEK
jgi:outer membrane lipoprotein